MRWILAPLACLFADLAAAQPAPPLATGDTPPAVQTPWDPVSQYISAGQDEPGYRSWYLAAPWHAAQVKSFNDYLAAGGVAGVVPTWQLLRTATSWKDCASEPFEVPPTSEWPHMVQTLRYIRDQVIPTLGPVEPVSVYRNPTLNVCAGGAVESAHKTYSAIDMVPLKPITREDLERKLCALHIAEGGRYAVGLGFYAFLRFHIDTTKYRRWGTDPAVAADCPPIIHPEDVASVYQPPASAPPSDPLAPAPQALQQTPRSKPQSL